MISSNNAENLNLVTFCKGVCGGIAGSIYGLAVCLRYSSLLLVGQLLDWWAELDAKI